MNGTTRIPPAALEAALVDGMYELGQAHRLPRLKWTLKRAQPGIGVILSGMASSLDYDETDVGPVLRAWAHALEMFPNHDPEPGTTEYRSRSLSGMAIEVWGVTDSDQFHGRAQA